MIPLDLSHQVLATKEIRHQLLFGAVQGDHATAVIANMAPLNLRKMLHDLLIFFASTYSAIFGLTAGPPLHDPIAVAVILNDFALVEPLGFHDNGGERWHVTVVTDGLHSDCNEETGQLGRTRAIKAAPHEGGVRIPNRLNVEHFWVIIERCIQRAELMLAKQRDAE